MLKASPGNMFEIFLTEEHMRAAFRQISREAARFGVRVTTVDRRFLDRLTAERKHQGVVARVEAYHYLPFAELIERIAPASLSERILVLDGITDPRNFGALLRTAEAVGVRYIIIPKDRSVEVTPMVVKASAGAVHLVKISKVTNLRRALGDLKKNGYWIAGLAPTDGESLYSREYPTRMAVLLGSEGSGVRPINLKECDFVVSIPMLGKISSLNVSVAGGVFLYELFRQTRQPGADSPGGHKPNRNPGTPAKRY
jgi:23S rRNA (guanosine2251-2'-O)-methyltransferase